MKGLIIKTSSNAEELKQKDYNYIARLNTLTSVEDINNLIEKMKSEFQKGLNHKKEIK